MAHLVALGEAWGLWSWSVLRATGFPARLVLDLAQPELGLAVDRMLALESACRTVRSRLFAACNAAGSGLDRDGRRVISEALRRLARDRVPDPLPDAAAELVRGEFSEALARVESAGLDVKRAYDAATSVTSDALRRVAALDAFRTALLWQNRNAVDTGVDSLLRQPARATDTKARAHERLVASYLQRYCVKNDTIGFFGPVGWARFVPEPTAVTQRAGTTLTDRHTVYYEYWAIDALAMTLSRDPGIRPYLAPRRLPQFRLEGTVLHYPVDRTAPLSPLLAGVLARSDGERTARAIAAELALDAEHDDASEAVVFEAIEELCEAGALHWELEIPTGTHHPEDHLISLLGRVEDPVVRARALDLVADLDRGRAALQASSSAAELEHALTAFGATFTAATGAELVREHGKTYAGRTPVYLDCRRDLEVTIGRRVVDRLAGPLELILHSARWFTFEIASRYRLALGALHAELAATGAVSFDRFWQRVPAMFPGAAAPGSIVGEVRAELQRRWARVIAARPDELGVVRSVGALTAARSEFAAPAPGWPLARYQSPDLMIAARGPEAIEAGDFFFVLGELHSGFNTVLSPSFVKEHPDPEELVRARELDIERVGIAPVWSKAISQADYFSVAPDDLDLESGGTRSTRSASQVVAVSDLVVESVAGALVIATRDGAHRMNIIEFLEHHLIAESFAAFTPFPAGERSPRITIDDVVVARASWRVVTAELEWLTLADPAARFLGARRWARVLGLPRWVFVKTTTEVKPVYVDFESTVFVELVAKLLRGAPAATFSEMLPTVEHAWVIDGAGERYCSELRVAAVDPVAWQPQ